MATPATQTDANRYAALDAANQLGDYESLYGEYPEADPWAWFTQAQAGGDATQAQQAAADDDWGLGQWLALAGALYGGYNLLGGLGGLGSAAGAAEAGAGMTLGDASLGAMAGLGDVGMEGAFLGAGVDPIVGADAAAGAPMYGAAEAPFMGAGVDPVTAADAAQGTPMYGAAAGGLPSVVTLSNALKAAQLAKGLTADTNQFPNLFGGGQGFGGQGGSSGGSSFMRKSRAPLQQPAFLGSGEQQYLGSAEDTAFNQASGGRREDVQNRAKQMASQLRGRPATFWRG